MPVAFKPGDSVQQKVKVIKGTVQGAEVIDNELQFKVAYIGEDNEPHERFFKEDELEKE